MSSQFRPWMVMVNSFVTALVFMLAFTSALLWCLVATTHRSVVHAEGRFYCFCFASRYIRTKLHPFTKGFDTKDLRFERMNSVEKHFELARLMPLHKKMVVFIFCCFVNQVKLCA